MPDTSATRTGRCKGSQQTFAARPAHVQGLDHVLDLIELVNVASARLS